MTTSSNQINFFKKEAKSLLKQFKAEHSDAIKRIELVLNNTNEISLMRTQHVVAVEYGFLKWNDLITAPLAKLDRLIEIKKAANHNYEQNIVTPLANLYRQPKFFPTPPHLKAIGDMFDRMTQAEQESYLNADARKMGLFNRN